MLERRTGWLRTATVNLTNSRLMPSVRPMTSIASNVNGLAEPVCRNVLAIGPWERGEFKVVSSLIGEFDSWPVLSDCERASELLAAGDTLFDAILMAEPLPANYQQDEIEELRRLAPLAHRSDLARSVLARAQPGHRAPHALADAIHDAQPRNA